MQHLARRQVRTVMMAKVIWNAMKTLSGMFGAIICTEFGSRL